MVVPLITLIKLWLRKSVQNKTYALTSDMGNIFGVLCTIMNVRGYKTVIKLFPHEVSDMEPVTEMLQHCDYKQYIVPYVLVLWLSIIVLVPFDLTTIDSGSSSNQVELVKKIIKLGRDRIDSAGKLRDAASVMLSKLITRPDVVKSGECDLLIESLAV